MTLKKLQDICQAQVDNLSYIQTLLPEHKNDIKQVRFDQKKSTLIVCVEPWVWTGVIQEALEAERSKIEIDLNKTIRYMKVKYLLT